MFLRELSETMNEVQKIENLSLIIIGINFDKEFKDLIKKILKFNKSCYIDYDKLEELRSKMIKTGVVQADKSYSYEKYNK